MNFFPKTRQRKAGTGTWGMWLAFCLAGVAGLEQGLAVQPEYLVDVWQTSEGLPQNSVTAIVQTRDGYLWFGTFNGLIRFDGVKFRVYDESNTPELKSSRIVRLFEDSRVYYMEEELAVNGEVWERHAAGRERGLPVVIPAGRGQFEFRYTAPSFVVPEKVRFKYKLEGLDQDWVDAGSRRTAYYSHIPPGKYRFNVMAGNNDGVWNEQGAELWLTILPPVWRPPWVVLMLGMLGVSGIAGTVRYLTAKKLQRRLDRLQQQHAVERERARIARDIHDDLGSSLTQITLLSELARSDLGHPEEAEAHIRQISDMARKLTRSMDEIVWAVNPLNDTLEGLTTYICKLSQEYLLVAGIRCRLDVPAQFPHYPLSTEVRHNLFLAFKEALNNVVKHAEASEALIRLKLVPDGLVLEVEDNGNGSRAAVQGNGGGLGGNGLVNMKKRMEDIGGEFELETRPESGLRCRLTVPLRRG
jgi:signal transduction histidine kinase